MKRIWLDTVVLASLTDAKGTLNKLIEDGHTLVIANTAIDVACFQENADWFEDQLKKGSIVIQIWLTPDQMVAKNFFWSSVQKETPAAESFAEAVVDLQNKDALLQIANLVNKYGIPKGDWPAGKWSAPEPLSKEVADGLVISEAATRTEVLLAAQKCDRMDLFDKYNVGYVRGLAIQHLCDVILKCDGTLAEVNS